MSESIETLCKFISHGVYVIGVNDRHHQHAFTAAWVMQVSFEPLLLAFSINPQHRSYAILKSGGQCSINVLGKDQQAIAAHFGTPGLLDKMAGFEWQHAKSSAPILSQALVYFDCVVSHFAPAGDHEIVVCNVLDARQLTRGVPLLYQETDNMDGASELYTDPLKN